ncbi:hypothetical protein [Pseudochryseolinea flava]|nr:hypothetical protein [Pseudochryseolinea flava]
MLIEEHPLRHWINHFFGFGTWQAKVWFVGFEEGGGDLPEEVADKLNYFYRHHGNASDATLCDIRDLSRNVAFRIDGPRADKFNNLYDHRFAEHAVLHGTWKNLIAFAHGFRNESTPDLRTYQQQQFTKSSEALIKLYPLPAHNHAWYYSWLDLSEEFAFLKTRSLYEQHVFSLRIKQILNCISEYQPEVVLMYGMNNINALKSAIQEKFSDVKFKMVKGIKLQVPQHHIADINGTTKLILTTQIPALRHNRKETGFDWEALGRSLRSRK